MPFIVTTVTPPRDPDHSHSGNVITRRAVATLEEALQLALPDGTVIEVEDISPLMLGSRCQASGELMMGCLRDDDWAPLIAAFNAREARR